MNKFPLGSLTVALTLLVLFSGWSTDWSLYRTSIMVIVLSIGIWVLWLIRRLSE